MPYIDIEKKKANAREYHKKTWEIRREKHYKLAQKRKKEIREWFRDFKTKLKCVECGESHFSCLDFDHSNPSEKYGDVSSMVSMGFGKETILKEINKCVVRCKNCHSKRTFKQRELAQLVRARALGA